MGATGRAVRSVAMGRAVLWVLAGVLGLVLVAGYVGISAAGFGEGMRREWLVTGHPVLRSDLYVVALGARALAAGRDPYGDAFQVELHQALYGTVLQPSPLVPNVAAFAYPPYVVLLMWPLLGLPYEVVRWIGTLLMAAAVCAAAVWWVRLVRGAAPRWVRVAAAAAALVSLPSLELIWLQQPTGVVLLLLVAAHAAAARGRYAVAGGLLALATVKPQLTVLVGGGLLFWALWRRARWPLLAGFGATMLGQLLVSEWLLPGWPRELAAAVSRYSALNAASFWLPALVVGSRALGAAVVAAPLALTLAALWWRQRYVAFGVPLLRTAALGFALTVCLLPDSSFYNRTLLIVPLLTLWIDGAGASGAGRAAYRAAAAAVTAPVLLMGVAEWVRWLMPAPAQTTAILGAALWIVIFLPLLLLPALLMRCVEQPHRPAAALQAIPPA